MATEPFYGYPPESDHASRFSGGSVYGYDRLTERIDGLERTARAAADAGVQSRRSTAAICLSMIAAVIVVAILLVLERAGTLRSADLGEGSLVTRIALTGTLVNAVVLVILGFLRHLRTIPESEFDRRPLDLLYRDE